MEKGAQWRNCKALRAIVRMAPEFESRAHEVEVVRQATAARNPADRRRRQGKRSICFWCVRTCEGHRLDSFAANSSRRGEQMPNRGRAHFSNATKLPTLEASDMDNSSR